LFIELATFELSDIVLQKDRRDLDESILKYLTEATVIGYSNSLA
jgi:hypothetical protein